MIQVHNNPQDKEITYYKVYQKIYFKDSNNPIEVDKRGPYKAFPEALMLKLQQINNTNLAAKSFALEMGDAFYTRIIIVKE